jgi:hypothetical protein
MITSLGGVLDVTKRSIERGFLSKTQGYFSCRPRHELCHGLGVYSLSGDVDWEAAKLPR